MIALALLSLSGPSYVRQSLDASDQQLYAIARYNMDQREAASLERAVREFRLIRARNPNSALALSGLAESMLLRGEYTSDSLRSPALAQAYTFARRATTLSPESSEAHAALGLAEVFAGGSGIPQFKRAVALDNRSFDGHLWYGVTLLRRGDLAGASRELQTAYTLDPTSPAAGEWLAQAAFYARDYRRTEFFSRRALDIEPGRQNSIAILGLSFELRRRFEEAARVYRGLASIDPVEGSVLLSHLYAVTGNVDAGRKLLHSLRITNDYRNEHTADIALAYAGVGDRGTAYRLLQRQRPSAHITPALDAIDPRLAPLQSGTRR